MGKYNIFIVIIIAVLFRAYVLNSLFPIYYNWEPLFFTDILGRGFRIPFEITIFAGIGNIILIWLIGKRFINRQTGEISALIYAISPWTSYLEISGSFYIFLLMCLLLSFLGLNIMKQKKLLGSLLFVVGLVVAFYSSFWSWLIIPILLVGAIRTKLLCIKNSKNILLILVATLLPLIFLSLKNTDAAKNIMQHQITVFSDVGLLNAVNSFRGEVLQTQFSSLGKLIENRYTYFLEHFFISGIVHLNPTLYFTPDVKLLGYSLSPPIFLGFLIPFMIGLSMWYKLWQKHYRSMFVLLFLIVPSLFSIKGLDTGKLILFSPILFFTTGFGISHYLISKPKYYYLKILVCVLVVGQLLITMADLPSREPNRLEPIRMEHKP